MFLCLTLHFNTALNALSMKTNTERFNLVTLGVFCLTKTLAGEARLILRGVNNWTPPQNLALLS